MKDDRTSSMVDAVSGILGSLILLTFTTEMIRMLVLAFVVCCLCLFTIAIGIDFLTGKKLTIMWRTIVGIAIIVASYIYAILMV